MATDVRPPASGSGVRRRPWLLGAVAVAIWLAVDLVFVAGSVNWIALPDPGVYWEAARDGVWFNSDVPPAFPLVWRALADALPGVSPALLGQAICLVSYVAMVLVAFEVVAALGIPWVWPATALIAVYPFIGATSAVVPRSNALLRLVSFVAVLAYVQRRQWTLVAALALLPLLHRSALPLVAAVTAAALWERRLAPWTLLPIGLPLLGYWVTGGVLRHEAFWFLTWNDAQPTVLGLPMADGLLGTLVLGLHGSLTALVKGLGLSVYWLIAVALLWRAWRRGHPLMMALAVPTVCLGLYLPLIEIWSTLNYTTFLAVPLLVALHEGHHPWLDRRAPWAWFLAGCLLSQFVWAIYMLRSWEP